MLYRQAIGIFQPGIDSMTLKATSIEVSFDTTDDSKTLEVRFEHVEKHATIRIDVDAPIKGSLDEAFKAAHADAVLALERMLKTA